MIGLVSRRVLILSLGAEAGTCTAPPLQLSIHAINADATGQGTPHHCNASPSSYPHEYSISYKAKPSEHSSCREKTSRITQPLPSPPPRISATSSLPQPSTTATSRHTTRPSSRWTHHCIPRATPHGAPCLLRAKQTRKPTWRRERVPAPCTRGWMRGEIVVQEPPGNKGKVSTGGGERGGSNGEDSPCVARNHADGVGDAFSRSAEDEIEDD